MQCLRQQIQDLRFKINAREILFDKDLENQISITQLIILFRKTQCNCVLIKVLLDFFQKIVGYWGNAPRSYQPINISTASRSVVTSPTLPGKITYGVNGNLLSVPVCHTGIPGRI